MAEARIDAALPKFKGLDVVALGCIRASGRDAQMGLNCLRTGFHEGLHGRGLEPNRDAGKLSFLRPYVCLPACDGCHIRKYRHGRRLDSASYEYRTIFFEDAPT
ncbi:hypothetical protein SBA2_670007 [Acidobacteriia bacterium SbA2]|nr:hypothetical protein SBA2_670007 [Acidobacteriia bacterium SbA2]